MNKLSSKMNTVVKTSVFFMSLISSAGFSQSNCQEADPLFDDSGVTYSCQSETHGEVCVKAGYHDNMELDGLRIFDRNEDTADRIDFMIFHDPKLLGCFPTLGFIACTNERVHVTEDRIKGWRYKGPNVFNSGSSHWSFKLEGDKAHLSIDTRNHSGKVEIDYEFDQCEKIEG